MKILVIEDSHFLRIAIEKILANAGYSVCGVAGGAEGLSAAQAESPALILLDMMLPGLDGLSVLKALKLDPLTARIPVIVLSGLSQKNEARLKGDGAAAFIEKSTLDLENNTNVLLDSIEGVIRNATLVLSPAVFRKETGL
jgi:CheY-like chemotaxis protein